MVQEVVEERVAAVGGARTEQVLPLTRFPERTVSRDQIEGLEHTDVHTSPDGLTKARTAPIGPGRRCCVTQEGVES